MLKKDFLQIFKKVEILWKQSYEIKSFWILPKLSENHTYIISIDFWKFKQNQRNFYFMTFLEKWISADLCSDLTP